MKNITILGAGTTGYLTTMFLCKNYPEIEITWIYPETNNPIGVGEATIPQVINFLDGLGITKEIILKELGGSIKLGIKFTDFYENGSSYNHSFGYSLKDSYNFDYIMNTNLVPDNILENTMVATHFDVRQLMRYLDNQFLKFQNLTIIRDTINDVSTLNDEFILDCRGFSNSNPDYVSISDKIPNDRALVYRSPYKDMKQRVPYTEAVAKNHGWIWNIPLRNEMSMGYVYDSKYQVKEEFIEYIKSIYGEVDETKLIDIPMITGRNNNHFEKIGDKTILRLGLRGAFIEPLESTGLYLITFAIKTLEKLINGVFTEEDYNNIYNTEFDVILDFIVAHYKFSKRSNDYWDFYKNVSIDLYKQNNIFYTQGWEQVLSGYGMVNLNFPKYESLEEINEGELYTNWLDKFIQK